MTLEIRPLSEQLGAEARGVDLSGPVDADTRAQLNRAFSENSVLAIRGQQLTANQMLAAVQLFGEVFQQHNTRFALPECPQIHYLSNQDKYEDGKRYIPGSGYHTDHSNAVMPPKATVLLAIRLPDKGGDTQYVNMQRAYEDLPDETKARIADLKGIHVYQSKHSARKLMPLSPEAQKNVPKAVEHPIVRTHPETGRKALFVNPGHTDHILGMDEAESRALLDELFAHATDDAFVYRHKWRLHDLVFWDNRCLMHIADPALPGYDRHMHRTTVEGDRPY